MSYQVINKTDAIKTETLVCLIYGDAGIGKTSLSFTTNNALLLDFDGGTQRACYRATTVRVEKWEDVNSFITSPDFKTAAPKTLILDTAGGMLDNYIAGYVRNEDPKNRRRGGELSLQGYGAMKDCFTQFKNWAKQQKINLIFVAHTTSIEEGDNTKFIPKITGGSYDILRQECDLVGYIYSNKNQRVIDFNPCDSHIGKNCAEIPLTVIPHYTASEYPLFFQSVIDKTLAHMNALNESQLETVKRVEEFKVSIDKIDDLKGANKVLKAILKETERAVQLQQFNILKTRAVACGLKYDGGLKSFTA